MKVKNATQNVKDTINLQPKITVQGKVVHFENNEQTLLDCLESADIEVHFHCRDGFCGACRVTLVEGEINYPQGEPLAFVGENEILPCCCIPVTDITLKIDD
ncbi:MAG: class I ribonucleotide reductase maintenance protein YfaE [Colwellia sp.]|nr:class I ribonucleotide reductase maintenance protein YfaE [Colwellia sp.]